MRVDFALRSTGKIIKTMELPSPPRVDEVVFTDDATAYNVHDVIWIIDGDRMVVRVVLK